MEKAYKTMKQVGALNIALGGYNDSYWSCSGYTDAYSRRKISQEQEIYCLVELLIYIGL